MLSFGTSYWLCCRPAEAFQKRWDVIYNNCHCLFLLTCSACPDCSRFSKFMVCYNGYQRLSWINISSRFLFYIKSYRNSAIKILEIICLRLRGEKSLMIKWRFLMCIFSAEYWRSDIGRWVIGRWIIGRRAIGRWAIGPWAYGFDHAPNILRTCFVCFCACILFMFLTCDWHNLLTVSERFPHCPKLFPNVFGVCPIVLLLYIYISCRSPLYHFKPIRSMTARKASATVSLRHQASSK